MLAKGVRVRFTFHSRLRRNARHSLERTARCPRSTRSFLTGQRGTLQTLCYGWCAAYIADARPRELAGQRARAGRSSCRPATGSRAAHCEEVPRLSGILIQWSNTTRGMLRGAIQISAQQTVCDDSSSTWSSAASLKSTSVYNFSTVLAQVACI